MLTLSNDKHSTMAIFSLMTGVQLHSIRGDTLRIMDIKWFGANEWVSGGINHVKFWKIENNQVKFTRGKFDNKNYQLSNQQSHKEPSGSVPSQRIMCLAVNKKDILAGTSQGNLLVWKRISDVPVTHPISLGEKSECEGGCIESIVVTEQ